MTNKEILEKAIKKSIDNGFDKFPDGMTRSIKRDTNSGENVLLFEEDGIETKRLAVSTLIYDHDFAKALWGEERVYTTGDVVYDAAWIFHLQQMVIADDPIKYLGEHLDD